VVVVTNATSYVGPASVDRLLRDGARVIAQVRDTAEARKAYLDAHPGAVITEADEASEIISAAIAAYERLDAVVGNDDAPAIRASLEDAELSDFRQGIEAMLIRPFALAKAAAKIMKAQGGGRILMITSAAPLRGLTNYSMYAAARGGANALMLSLSRELAPHHIVVNAIAPNYVANPTYFPPSLLDDPKARAKIERNIPLGRLGTPEEVGALVSFFAIGDCGFVTGHVVPIAGGWA